MYAFLIGMTTQLAGEPWFQLSDVLACSVFDFAAFVRQYKVVENRVPAENGKNQEMSI